ncbi:MAG: choloylglycine hydrolase, partial [Massilibacteroides sp.]|nr:choloylglycine hydrolase [Massilibacteroides sp.]
EPNISSTQWRTVADQKSLVYYFENVVNPNVIWLDFAAIDFSEKGKVLKLSLDKNENYAGESSKDLIAATPFKPLSLEK